MERRKWRLVVEYEGTRYRGWQEQRNARTVQGELRRAAEDLLDARVLLAGAGRTDAGVHALFQIAHLEPLRPVPPFSEVELRHGLNDRLPADINVRRVDEADWRFHARHDAVERFYLYQLATRRTAFGKPFVWWVKDRLDAEEMRRAARRVVGMHDFSNFQEVDADGRGDDGRVKVTSCELRADGDLLLLRIGASHFLWKMVRRLVGGLVEVGRGNLAPDGLLRLRHSEAARVTAPPAGLFLEYVRYRGDPPPLPLRPAYHWF
ncbi:MAG: tRNA pseudouridine(38-40) synthase TruA [Acidobacteriota bacterium]|jgi:tRNA pseudouridine38-40 synthase|nr:tRNA pseudouridine(38-40) synthase TruA [Acidobacteriota bacterium]